MVYNANNHTAGKMTRSQAILSDVIHHMKYAKYQEEKARREIYVETVDRNKNMHISQYPHLTDLIIEAYDPVYEKNSLPSMRSLQFGGPAILKNPARMYNCSSVAVNNLSVFSEVFFLLLSGAGVGYSIQTHHVRQLPPINKGSGRRRFLVPDTIEGWAMAVDAMVGHLFRAQPFPVYDFSDIREQGTPLRTSGGKAPGPEPLAEALHSFYLAFKRLNNGDKARPIHCHRGMCRLAIAVLSGGIRRSSFVALFSRDDMEMMTCKSGEWWKQYPEYRCANNSVVLHRRNTSERDFWEIWKIVADGGSGEPGIFWTHDYEMLSNPCMEISIPDMGLCNLVEINAATLKNQKDLNHRARMAARIATLQASYTDFHYLRYGWIENARRDALIGVSLTGIAGGNAMDLDLRMGAQAVLEENEYMANQLGINRAARATTVKPAGTTSLVFGCSSGIHPYWDDFYIRRITVGKHEPIYELLCEAVPELIEDSVSKPILEAKLSVPIKAPDGATTREEGPFELLERVKKVYREWILPGHRRGPNTNNISCTVNIRPDEWDDVGKWMWNNAHSYAALSVLPFDGGNYLQAPHETISEETYLEMSKHLKSLDLTSLLEFGDNTNLSGELACSGGMCIVT